VARIQKSKRQLTPLELRIMQVLWADGPSLVQAVQSRLGEDLAYTTVQTMLNVLERKGRVSRKLVGRAYEYRALQNQDAAQGNAIHDLLSRMFDGSVEGMVMNMVRTKQIDATKLSEIARRVAEAEGAPDAGRK
jgi:predicted transcriptional regulator